MLARAITKLADILGQIPIIEETPLGLDIDENIVLANISVQDPSLVGKLMR